jgi:thioredoxin 1
MAAANILELTDDNFDSEVRSSDQPVLVDFWAPWCGPCKMLGPILDELAGEFEGKAKIGKVNIDEHQGVAGQYGVSSIPTILIFKGGEVVEQHVGLKPKAALADSLNSAAG